MRFLTELAREVLYCFAFFLEERGLMEQALGCLVEPSRWREKEWSATHCTRSAKKLVNSGQFLNKKYLSCRSTK